MQNFRPVMRTIDEKRDLRGSWNRSDAEFFAAGACHILCAAFLQNQPGREFSAHLIRPTDGARGAHVIATSSSEVFDWRGFTQRDEFLRKYADGYREVFSNWEYQLVAISDAVDREVCELYHLRQLSQFPEDPWARARLYLRKLLIQVDSAPGNPRIAV